MGHGHAGTIWWRPDRGAAPLRAAAVSSGSAGSAGSRVAFNALVAFTGILLLTPQTMIPVLKSLRIALVAGGLAIIGHMFDATLRRRPMLPAAPEVVDGSDVAHLGRPDDPVFVLAGRKRGAARRSVSQGGRLLLAHRRDRHDP